MVAISLEDTGPIMTAEDVLHSLKSKLGFQSDEEVFVEAFTKNKMPDGRAEYRMFLAAGSRYLPPCVERLAIDLIKIPYVQRDD